MKKRWADLNKNEKRMVILVTITALIAICAIFLSFIFMEKCKNLACWEFKLEKCRRASYISDHEDITWKYTIEGRNKQECRINVEIIQIKKGITQTEVLEGKSMDCYLPRGVIAPPEVDPNNCHGPLKEQMQELIIEKLHQYILENVGEINEELKSAV